jgi:hypothetical protein
MLLTLLVATGAGTMTGEAGEIETTTEEVEEIGTMIEEGEEIGTMIGEGAEIVMTIGEVEEAETMTVCLFNFRTERQYTNS